jgi:hypothetical protein
LYNNVNEYGVPIKLVTLTKICLNGTYSKVHKGKQLSDTYPFLDCPKQGTVLSLLLFNFALKYANSKVQKNQIRLKLNRTHHLEAYPDGVNVLGDNIKTIKNMEALVGPSK